MESSIDPLRSDMCILRNLYNDFPLVAEEKRSMSKRNSRFYGSQDVLEYPWSALYIWIFHNNLNNN